MQKLLLSSSIVLFLILPFSLSWADFVEFPNENNASTIQKKASYFNNISDFFSFALAIVFILSIFGMAYSGLAFIMAGGDENGLEKARAVLFSSIVGLVISMVGYISLNLLKYFF